MNKPLRLIGLVVALLAWVGVGAAHAAAGDWQNKAEVAVRLVTAVDATGDLTEIPAGLHVRLAPGWKSYWRAPGDAGLPPTLDWAGSSNLESADLSYPAPHRFSLFGLESFGYSDEVVYPLALRPARPGAPLDLRATLDLLVCSDICIPHRFDLALALPAGPAAPGGEAYLIDQWRARVPDDGAVSGIVVENAYASATSVVVEATAREPFAAPDVLLETALPIAVGVPDIRLSDQGRRLRAVLPVSGSLPEGASLVGERLTVTVVDGPRAAEHGVVAQLMPERLGPLLGALGVALLGGFILNLMPCVLPVLYLKLVGAARLGGAAPGAVRAGFLATAAGILASFAVLAAGLILAKAAGASVGWGVQFQQPLFLVLMVLLLTLFAANLAGFYEINLPHRLSGALGGADAADGLAGHFATGALATLLATPCSAPFVGTAVGFALARGPAEILAIFLALGIGLALPYLGVAAVPALARLLPRPGRWMLVLRRVLALALAGTALWLLTVLAAQAGTAAALGVGGLMIALSALTWGWRYVARRRTVLGGLAAALAAGAFAVPGLVAAPATMQAPSADGLWQPFSLVDIGAEVAAGRTVLVDVTADWCLTCKTNKALVLDRGAVRAGLEEGSYVARRADWTRPDPAIADYLAGFGRYGIPFNAVYGPAAPQGIALPELLTEDAVLDALARASGR